jgi:3-dehydroquinate dehydratase type I
MFNSGADAIKITCMANDEKDGEILTGLYQKLPNIIAFGMGEHGIKSRIESMFLGNGITYAAPDNGKSTAPGQLTLSQMKEIYKKRTEG